MHDTLELILSFLKRRAEIAQVEYETAKEKIEELKGKS